MQHMLPNIDTLTHYEDYVWFEMFRTVLSKHVLKLGSIWIMLSAQLPNQFVGVASNISSLCCLPPNLY